MSAFLEFRRICVAIPTIKATHEVEKQIGAVQRLLGQQRYLMFCEGGDSNLIDLSGKVVRAWCLAASGTAAQIMQVITAIANDDVAGGMICLKSRSKRTSPEDYIRTYCRAIIGAISWDDAVHRTPSLALKLYKPAMAGFNELWPARDRYFTHLETSGCVERVESHDIIQLRPFSTGEGLADALWLSSLGRPYVAPACLHTGNTNIREHLEQLHVLAAKRRVAYPKAA